MKVFASRSKKTILRVSGREDSSIISGCDMDQKWPDREIESRWRPKAGDGTVPFDSAHPVTSVPEFELIPHQVFKGGHGALPGKKPVIKALAEFFNANATQ